MTIYALMEAPSGYVLLKASKKIKSTEALMEKLQHDDIDANHELFKLVAYEEFSNIQNACENCVCVAEGDVNDQLKAFLQQHISVERGDTTLIVLDKKIMENLKEANLFAAAASSVVGITSESKLVFALRSIRMNLDRFLDDKGPEFFRTAHVGLSHGYSRIKVKYSAKKADNMVMATVNLLDQMDKDVNTASMRLREWFGYHFPELYSLVPDNAKYARCVELLKSRDHVEASETAAAADDDNDDDAADDDVTKKQLPSSTLSAKLAALLDNDSQLAERVLNAAHSSIGTDLTEGDVDQIAMHARQLIRQIDRRAAFSAYLRGKMSAVAANTTALIGETIGARLISQAGSLTNLAKFPASTIQILGAEKALFRALKARSRVRTPKYGLIFHSAFISRASAVNKGRISRFLAAKLALCTRLDCFGGVPGGSAEPSTGDVWGVALRNHVENRLKYLEAAASTSSANGGAAELPAKNAEVMAEAMKEAREKMAAATRADKLKKSAIKTLVAKEASRENTPEDAATNKEESVERVKKEKKKNKNKLALNGGGEEEDVEEVVVVNEEKGKKKKSKKRKLDEMQTEQIDAEAVTAAEMEEAEEKQAVETPIKKKKKRNKFAASE